MKKKLRRGNSAKKRPGKMLMRPQAVAGNVSVLGSSVRRTNGAPGEDVSKERSYKGIIEARERAR